MKRRLSVPTQYNHACNVEELRMLARRRLPNFAFEYLDGGAEDEVTMRANRSAFERWRFVPKTLVDTQRRDLSSTLFGKRVALPLIVAPTGFNGIYHRHADLSLARAAARTGIPFTLSTVSNRRVDELARDAGGRVWMQLYMLKDRAVTSGLMYRAAQAGCDTLVLTTDATHLGNREWAQRPFRAPMKLNWRNRVDALCHPRWIGNVLMPNGAPTFANLAEYLPAGQQSVRSGMGYMASQMDASITWDDVAWLRERWKGTLIVKGVLDADDATRAIQAGAEGLVVSNHGGRQLDGTVPSIDVLAEIVRVCAGRATVIVDSGFRRGTDVVKALALGAHAVMIGRPVLYGVAAGGEQGALHALSLLGAEIDRTLGQLGCPSIEALGPQFLRAA
ncbi:MULTISPECIES: alpha-hydroxy acid oxidase [Burkholderia]|uniref:alpha-hydroxy acid oxidase n=1 Tax=Burkholderia TaxID=32008 RepID=UPI000F59E966|nr:MULTISPECIES: alpha-hydroxy acid oxidase [Burkholderia]MBN3738832.1 alpha-hydroxy-acid oxidizing protein [Burkholderia sp. Tr-20355]MCA8302089.1 alpha-hydroxy-acid oxidizing protein [Burkholderia seminalis]MCA8431105.1 alpha-hydroxy-acid oxidizing protein [Burkholderia seminalis]RQS82682.1 alpha-hydroxy-acid oxidizing protein [Burkholderia seminalis]